MDLDADIYTANNDMQLRHAVDVLDSYLNLVRWRKSPSIMDIGTGDGSVLLDILVPRLPEDFQKVVGVDVSQELLDIAKTKSGNNPKIDFVRMDIASSLPVEFLKQFDNIFSFYCIHWIREQRRLFTNMLAILKPGGDMLLTLIAKDPSEIHRKMAKISQWAPFMTDVEKFIYPYQDSSDPVSEIKEHLKFVGFVDYQVHLIDKVEFFENLTDYWNFASGINPFLKRIPPDLLGLYKRDYLNEVKQSPNILFKGEGKIQVVYGMIVVYAAKADSNN